MAEVPVTPTLIEERAREQECRYCGAAPDAPCRHLHNGRATLAHNSRVIRAIDAGHLPESLRRDLPLGLSRVFLVIGRQGILWALPDRADADERARATESLLVQVPVIADYRCTEDKG